MLHRLCHHLKLRIVLLVVHLKQWSLLHVLNHQEDQMPHVLHVPPVSPMGGGCKSDGRERLYIYLNSLYPLCHLYLMCPHVGGVV